MTLENHPEAVKTKTDAETGRRKLLERDVLFLILRNIRGKET